MKVKIIFVVIFLAGLIVGGFVTGKYVSKVKDKEFARTEKVWKYVYDKQSAAYDSLANQSRITIQNKFDKVKNTKGNMYFIPSSTIEIDKAIERYKVNTDTLKIPEK